METRKQILIYRALQISLVLALFPVIFVTGFVLSSKLNNASFSPIDFGSLEEGPVTSGGLLFQYYQDKGKLEIVRENDRFIRFTNMLESGNIYNGFGIFREMAVGDQAILYLTWRAKGFSTGLEIHLIDTPPFGRIGSEGEIFHYSVPQPGEVWETIEIPVGNFKVNSWQSDEAFLDGILNTSPLSSLEIGIEPNSEIVIDVKDIRFTWDIAPFQFIIQSILIILFIPVFLFRIIRMPAITDRGAKQYLAGIFNKGFLLSGSVAYSLILALMSRYELMLRLQYLFTAFFFILLILDFISASEKAVPLLPHFYYVLFLGLWLLLPRLNYPAFVLLFSLTLIPYAADNRKTQLFLILALTTVAVFFHPLMISREILINHLIIIYLDVLILYLVVRYLRIKIDDQALERTRILYSGLMKYSVDSIITLSPEGRITGFNRGFQSTGGWIGEELMDKEFCDFLHPQYLENTLFHSRCSEDCSASYDCVLNLKNGKSLDVNIREYTLFYREEMVGYQLIATDISERKKMEERLLDANTRLETLVHTDQLTGINNRRYFDAQLLIEWRRACRSSETLSLLMVDIDYFKKYNDTYGHQIGDNCLHQVAQCLKTNLKRATDFLARYGGEEFAVILPGTDDISAAKVAEKLIGEIRALAIPHKASLTEDIVTISLGIHSISPEAGDDNSDIKALIEKADKALYEAKRRGRNRYVIYEKWISE